VTVSRKKVYFWILEKEWRRDREREKKEEKTLGI